MFSKDFLFGVSMSGFQFEMAGEDTVDPNTDWFVWTHNPENIICGLVSGDLPENGVGYWKFYDKIHDLIVSAGMNILRIGIEWSRIFPRPTFGVPYKDLKDICDKGAIEHYREIIKNAKEKGLRVILDLNHFTLPLWIHDPIAVRLGDYSKSGWLDERIATEFAKFSKFVVENFDDIVDLYSTMNEPHVVAQLGYISHFAGFPPSILSLKSYKTSLDNMIEAHNMAYDYMKSVTDKPIGIIYSITWFDGDETKDKAMYDANWYFLDGVAEKCDFLGVNYYTRAVVRRRKETINFEGYDLTWETVPGYGYSCSPNSISLDGRPSTDIGWEVYPEGLEYSLDAVWNRYKKPIYVTENGVADAKDVYRPAFLIAHLKRVESSLEKGIDVRGYLHWSIVDNYEWAKGYNMRFGLVYVDFENHIFAPRPSYYIYSEIIKSRTVKGMEKFLENWRLE